MESGADLYTIYTRKDVAGDDLSGEPDLTKYIRVPKDLCVALTQDTDGSYFSARQWLDSRPVIQKRFTDVMVRVFASKAQPSVCQDCECVADELGVGYSQCSNCNPRYPVNGVSIPSKSSYLVCSSLCLYIYLSVSNSFGIILISLVYCLTFLAYIQTPDLRLPM